MSRIKRVGQGRILRHATLVPNLLEQSSNKHACREIWQRTKKLQGSDGKSRLHLRELVVQASLQIECAPGGISELEEARQLAIAHRPGGGTDSNTNEQSGIRSIKRRFSDRPVDIIEISVVLIALDDLIGAFLRPKCTVRDTGAGRRHPTFRSPMFLESDGRKVTQGGSCRSLERSDFQELR